MTSSTTYADWVEILCGNKIKSATVVAIQKALRAKGYDPGLDDNVLGPRTNAAIIKYQKDNNLPSGNLNLETLKSLGVEY
jgi:peptidoglycan hydrolase-like protein with peptidoglycan-binding domain